MTAPETLIEWLARALTGLLGFLGVWLWNRVGKVEEKLNLVELAQASNYASRTEVMAGFDRLEAKIDKLSDKLDGKADK